jgi:DNA-binding response OmpR family regulator
MSSPTVAVGAAIGSFASEVNADLQALGYEPAPLDLADPSVDRVVVTALFVVEKALADCAAASAVVRRDVPGTPILWIVGEEDLPQLDRYTDRFDDFLEAPFLRSSLDVRLRRLRPPGPDEAPETIRAGAIVVDPATYRASVDGRPLALTYMEYELLRFLATNAGRVHTREAILRNVWGYEYYGGIRTVDVHVRRLRAKLGQEHARAISTVRGVGYGFEG